LPRYRQPVDLNGNLSEVLKMRAVSISSLTLTLLAMLCLLAFTACGSAGGEEPPINSAGQPNVTMNSVGWMRVTGEWTYGETMPGACTNAKIVIESDASYTITECGESKAGILAESDFAILQNRMKPVLGQWENNTMCDLNPIADLSWMNKITLPDGRTRRVYFSSTQNGSCAMGTKSYGEALDATLDSIKTKYGSTQPAEGTAPAPETPATPEAPADGGVAPTPGT
jgi:hypothetical protein